MPRGQRRRRRGHSRRVARMLEPALLLLLHRDPAHGYTLLEHLAEFGLEGLDPSVVYRTLRNMEDRKWVASTWDDEQTQGPPRRVYILTALGNEVLAGWTNDLRETRRMIDYLLGSYRRHIEEGEGEHHGR